jgi:hypothetical protein
MLDVLQHESGWGCRAAFDQRSAALARSRFSGDWDGQSWFHGRDHATIIVRTDEYGERALWSGPV